MASRGSPARNRRMFSTRTSPSKWVTDPALDTGRLAASPMTNILGRAFDCRVCSVGGHEVELVAEPGGPSHVWRAAVEGDNHRQIEGNLTIVVGHKPAPLTVDFPGIELGDQVDALFLEEPGQGGGCDRLGEGAVERGSCR